MVKRPWLDYILNHGILDILCILCFDAFNDLVSFLF